MSRGDSEHDRNGKVTSRLYYLYFLASESCLWGAKFLSVCVYSCVCNTVMCCCSPFQTKENSLQNTIQEKKSLVQVHNSYMAPSSPWYTAIKKEETNLNFKVIHNPSSINVNVYIMCICMCVFYLIL